MGAIRGNLSNHEPIQTKHRGGTKERDPRQGIAIRTKTGAAEYSSQQHAQAERECAEGNPQAQEPRESGDESIPYGGRCFLPEHELAKNGGCATSDDCCPPRRAGFPS